MIAAAPAARRHRDENARVVVAINERRELRISVEGRATISFRVWFRKSQTEPFRPSDDGFDVPASAGADVVEALLELSGAIEPAEPAQTQRKDK